MNEGYLSIFEGSLKTKISPYIEFHHLLAKHPPIFNSRILEIMFMSQDPLGLIQIFTSAEFANPTPSHFSKIHGDFCDFGAKQTCPLII